MTALPNSDHGSRAYTGETGPTLSGKNQWTYLFGITLQMLSNCAGAAQNVYTKVLLSPKLSNQPAGGRPGSVVSKAQIALVTQPVIGVMGLFSVVFFENGDFTPPPFGSLLLFSLGVIGILVTELRLIELTSALTLAVLSAAHNVIMVVFFLCLDGEGGDISFTQGLGYAVNTVGCFLYAGVRYLQKQEEARLEMETNQYHATLLPPTIPEDRTSPPIVERN